MEIFTLVVWIMMGQRFEQTEIQGLSRHDCFERLLAIGGDRQLVKTQCLGANGYTAPRIVQSPVCAYAGGSCS